MTKIWTSTMIWMTVPPFRHLRRLRRLWPLKKNLQGVLRLQVQWKKNARAKAAWGSLIMHTTKRQCLPSQRKEKL
uniref:Uncharacterized protein n=1 Tax=Picea sitchensis TaxID=3332 RepID=A9NQD0_PICSI|nr:unknown [Picea sitchensis]